MNSNRVPAGEGKGPVRGGKLDVHVLWSHMEPGPADSRGDISAPRVPPPRTASCGSPGSLFSIPSAV